MQFIVRGLPRSWPTKCGARGCHRATAIPRISKIARGTGPCRCCLQPFVPGRDARAVVHVSARRRCDSLMAPGPVFIHAEHCAA